MDNPRYIDPSTKRKKEIVKKALTTFNGIPVFSIMEFNLANFCNRDCSFCPISDPNYQTTNERMDVSLYAKIMDDLASIHYQGRIVYSAFSEPLVHKKIETLIQTTKEKIPNSCVEMVSNGDIVTSKKLRKLFEAGLDTISISMYDGSHQIEQFTEMIEESGLTKEEVILRRRYYEDGNYGMTISNRAGYVDSNEYRDTSERQLTTLPLKLPCYYPFYMLLSDYNGNVLMCSHDWKKAKILGNLKHEHIWDIWTGKALQAVRRRMIEADRNFTPCNQCDVLGTVMGKENFDAWNHLKELN